MVLKHNEVTDHTVSRPVTHELSTDNIRFRIDVSGVVQGVGFRPFMFRVVNNLGLGGFVRNTTGGVVIEVEGAKSIVLGLIDTLRHEAPPLAQIKEICISEIPLQNELVFQIKKSSDSKEESALVSPDAATCDTCLSEMRNPEDQRYHYPFINCTNCGPRFTIVEGVPYDRKLTTMKGFHLCLSCKREYEDPFDRRFHAEPNACPSCGPQIMLIDSSGRNLCAPEHVVKECRVRLCQGQIVAIKGLGGFHLACDATNEKAVVALRNRKNRIHKPFAVMCADLQTATAYCEISDAEANELDSNRRPILLLPRRSMPIGKEKPIAKAVAPGCLDLGVMLPYTPLHHLLFERRNPACLVMTSGNICSEPIVAENHEAMTKLKGIADVFLVHDRPIRNRCDDSVGFVSCNQLVLTRRSRGFTPLPVELRHPVRPTLAVGAQMNNTFVVAMGKRAFFSQHIGDTDDLETMVFLRESIDRMLSWLGINPEIVAHDLHPNLLTTRLALGMADGRKLVPVQHHEAHLTSAMAATNFEGEAQGLVLDGTGLGTDGTIWGGELLVQTQSGCQRAGHLRAMPLPGGDIAVQRPIRTAIAFLHASVPEAADLPIDLWQRADPYEVKTVRQMVDTGVNTPLTSSAGRLFDAVASLLAVRDEVTYEGQAAIELEQLARGGNLSHALELYLNIDEDNQGLIIDPSPLLKGLVQGILEGESRSNLALAFHAALARVLAKSCAYLRNNGAPQTVFLCGGVYQNRILSRLTSEELRLQGLLPILPGIIPVNDAGLALGQTMVANTATQTHLATGNEG
ncbi:MAG: carbamoyltransferase HypF [Pseudomonadota bacterium]